MPNKRSVDMSEAFTLPGIIKLKVAIKKNGKQPTVLRFLGEDKQEEHHYKVKVTKDNRVLGKEIQMGSPEGLMVVEEGK